MDDVLRSHPSHSKIANDRGSVPVSPVIVGFVMPLSVIRMFSVSAMTEVIIAIRNRWKRDCEETEETQHCKDHSFHKSPPKVWKR
jgi:hypothetical protein